MQSSKGFSTRTFSAGHGGVDEASHVLHAGPDMVHCGYFDAGLAPALTSESGDSVRIASVNGK
jgi:hypothetical protein